MQTEENQQEGCDGDLRINLLALEEEENDAFTLK